MAPFYTETFCLLCPNFLLTMPQNEKNLCDPLAIIYFDLLNTNIVSFQTAVTSRISIGEPCAKPDTFVMSQKKYLIVFIPGICKKPFESLIL